MHNHNNMLLYIIAPHACLKLRFDHISESSLLRSSNNWKKFPALLSLCPQIPIPCLARYFRLDITFRRQCLLFNFSLASKLDSISPISGVVNGKVSIFSTASLWQRVVSWQLKETVASFQLQNPMPTCRNEEIPNHCNITDGSEMEAS